MKINLPHSISEQKDLICNKKASHVDLIDAYLERIEKYDKNINSFLSLFIDHSYQDAKKCDKLIADYGKDIYKKYPLLGITISLKDLFSMEGVRTTAGSKVLDNHISLYDATVVSRLKNAGCIIIGKTNCDAWAHGASGENSDFGPTKNPWCFEYVPGGSSSGSAAPVSSDFCLASTGTDTGGSIRQPANFCGIVGFKPSYGAVSRYGIVAMSSSLDSVGHFTNNIDDAKEIFDVTHGVDGFDSTVENIDIRTKDKATYTLGVAKEYFSEGIDKEVNAEIKRVIDIYSSNGYRIKEISLPLTKYAISVYYILQPAEVSSNLGRYDGIRYGHDRSYFGAEAKRRIVLGTYVLSSGYYDQYYIKAMKVREKIIQEYNNAFTEVDAIIAPVSPTTAFKLKEKCNDPLKMYLADIYTVAANIAGLPAIAIPSKINTKGLPLGFQIIGNRLNDYEIFKIGKSYEKISGNKIQKPSFS